jgi:mitotic spindle assembly checkpoint protein MAD1
VQFSRARKAVPDTPAATPVSITQSLSVLRLEHAHLLEEHGADRAALRQREAELAGAQAREVDARATVDTLLQAARAAEDRATRAERVAALAEREVGFLQALNVRSPFEILSVHHKADLFIYVDRRATRAKKPCRA